MDEPISLFSQYLSTETMATTLERRIQALADEGFQHELNLKIAQSTVGATRAIGADGAEYDPSEAQVTASQQSIAIILNAIQIASGEYQRIVEKKSAPVIELPKEPVPSSVLVSDE